MCLCILLPYATKSVFDGVLVCCCDIVYPYIRGGVMCATGGESVRVVINYIIMIAINEL